MVCSSVGSVLSGVWMSRTGEYKKATFVAAGMSLLSMIGYSMWDRNTSIYLIAFCFAFDGFSLGVILTTALIAMLSCVESKGKLASLEMGPHWPRKTRLPNRFSPTDMATITSMSYLFRSVGSVIGISATTAIFQALVKSMLTEQITGPDADKVISE